MQIDQIDLRIAIWNANGLSNHKDEIQVFLKSNNIDIILISETHFTNRSFFKIYGYDLICANHPDNKAHGGSAIIIKSSIRYRVMDSVSSNAIQAACIQVQCLHFDLSLSAVYFPPRFSINCKEYWEFFQKLGTRFIAGGDYNAKHPWWGSRLINPKGRQLYKCITDNNLSTLSTGKPTYWPSDPRKIPDLLDFIVYSGIPQHQISIAESFDLSSDHSPLIVTFNSVSIKSSSPYKIITSKTDITAFKNWLENNIDINVSLKTGTEIDLVVETLTNKIHEAGLYFTPPPKEKTRSSEFISAEIRRLIKHKRALRKKWQTSRSPEDKTVLNKARNELKKRLAELRNESTAEFLKNLDPFTHDFEYTLWRATRYLKRPTRRNVAIKDNNGVWCRSNEDKVEAFAQHLYTVFQPNPDGDRMDEEISNFLDAPCQMSLPISHISTIEVELEIKNTNSKKSPGYDKIDGKTLKTLPQKCIQLLTRIYNAMLRLDHYPTQWKCAEVIMIQKPNKPENITSSYRPISLLVTFSKVFERILLRRMLPVLENNNIIPEHQFGFRRGHGTVEQCHRIINHITEALESKKYCTAVFLDIQQAFDRVWHKGILYKIKKILPAPYYLLLKSYLTNRKFYVVNQGVTSNIYSINAGVPQGSVLGPVLYTIFTADLPVMADVNIATYADDTAIIATSLTPGDASLNIQKELNEIEKWLHKWKIRVNPQKSTHVTFTLRRGDCPPVNLCGTQIPQNTTVKYLGVHLDRRLTWRPHINAKVKQLNQKTKKMYWLFRKKSQLSLENKVRIYKAILKPVWTYALQLWGTASHSNVEIVQRYQSKTLRLITGSPWFVKNEEIHKDLNIPYVKEEIIKYSKKYVNRLDKHCNTLAINLLDNSQSTRRLKRVHILDLPDK